MKALNLIGKKFNRLTVINKTNERKNKKIIWECKCICKKITKATTGQLRSGNKKSCGCFSLENSKKSIHGYANTSLYKLWGNMISRCHGKNTYGNKFYKNKQIKVCTDWKTAKKFINWALKNGYKEKFQIHRKNNNKGYSPQNCEFISKKEHQKIHLIIKTNPLSNNTTGYVGVTQVNNRKVIKFSSSVGINKKRIYLGLFTTAKKAYNARINYLTQKGLI